MNDAVTRLRSLPLAAFEAPEPGDAWARCPLAAASDERLIQAVAAAITPPKVAIHSSFLLHAPLELLARAWLLQRLPPGKKEEVRRRIAEIAVRYAADGPEIESQPKDYSSVNDALQELSGALRAGDADTVDSALLFLLPRMSAQQLCAAGAQYILPCLGAAGHAPILLMMLPQAEGRLGGMGALLRAPLRALALEAGARLTWMDADAREADGGAPELFARLAALPSRIAVSSHGIAPLMRAVERDGHAARVLASPTCGLEAHEAERILLRVAALSMLQDDPAHAPYGWSHCLTLPQAVLSLVDLSAEVTRTVRIAATYVLGFRVTLGCASLRYPYSPEPPAHRLSPDPADAAAVAFNAAGGERLSLTAQLIAHAAAHPDAHLGKYTMACLIAADRHPEDASLYLAAAAYLGAWWASQAPA